MKGPFKLHLFYAGVNNRIELIFGENVDATDVAQRAQTALDTGDAVSFRDKDGTIVAAARGYALSGFCLLPIVKTGKTLREQIDEQVLENHKMHNMEMRRRLRSETWKSSED